MIWNKKKRAGVSLLLLLLSLLLRPWPHNPVSLKCSRFIENCTVLEADVRSNVDEREKNEKHPKHFLQSILKQFAWLFRSPLRNSSEPFCPCQTFFVFFYKYNCRQFSIMTFLMLHAMKTHFSIQFITEEGSHKTRH